MKLQYNGSTLGWRSLRMICNPSFPALSRVVQYHVSCIITTCRALSQRVMHYVTSCVSNPPWFLLSSFLHTHIHAARFYHTHIHTALQLVSAHVHPLHTVLQCNHLYCTSATALA